MEQRMWGEVKLLHGTLNRLGGNLDNSLTSIWKWQKCIQDKTQRKPCSWSVSNRFWARNSSCTSAQLTLNVLKGFCSKLSFFPP